MKVTVVLDRAYGGESHPELGPAFWLIESPQNREFAERRWQSGACDPNSAVFSGDGHRSPEAAAIAIFASVIGHHPD
jgi:hypothetical protein